MAHNIALKRRQANGLSERNESFDESVEGQQDLAPAVDEALEFEQSHQRLQAILKVLPERDRLCLTLRADGMRYRDIAQTLGMSLGAVSLSISRALARMERAEATAR